jgi:hypothetical protein
MRSACKGAGQPLPSPLAGLRLRDRVVAGIVVEDRVNALGAQTAQTLVKAVAPPAKVWGWLWRSPKAITPYLT